MNMAWWMWMLLGFVLLVAELLTPGGLFTIFFGVGALAVGLLALMGLEFTLAIQVLIFVVLSGVSLALFRKPLLERLEKSNPKREVDSLAGEDATILEEIPAGGYGKAELRGSTWTAKNLGERPLQQSARARVEKVDGLTLWVRG
jgi:hypothetical protein